MGRVICDVIDVIKAESHMTGDLVSSPAYRITMDRLEAARRLTSTGDEYWNARDINSLLGYPTWREFEHLVSRATDAMRNNGIDPSHQIVLTHKMMEVGKGGRLRGDDYFLSRSACYLIAMNGDPAKPEIAGAQAYFTIKTRQMEILEQQDSPGHKRLAARDRVTQSFKRVSGVAQEAGVQRQPLFHDARYQGLYGGRSTKAVKALKGVADKDTLFDFAGALELSAHEFQMNLAANVIEKQGNKGERHAIDTNRKVAERVRASFIDSNGTLPEKLALEEPIKNVRKKLGAQAKLAKPDSSGI